jgi:thymidylate synthase
LTHILAQVCDLEADEFVYFLGNAHIYEEHLDVLKEQIQRRPFPFPRISLNRGNTAKTIEDYDWKDIQWIEPYVSHPSLQMKMKS